MCNNFMYENVQYVQEKKISRSYDRGEEWQVGSQSVSLISQGQNKAQETTSSMSVWPASNLGEDTDHSHSRWADSDQLQIAQLEGTPK